MHIYSQKSFTLIELLVVIAIVGILAGIIIVSMSGATTNATIAKAKVFDTSMRDSMSQSIISEWNFDELSTATNGMAIKDSWGNNVGTLYTGSGDTNDKLLSGSNCVSGKCLNLDGTDDYIDCGNKDSLDLKNGLTISTWIYLKSNWTIGSPWMVIFDKVWGEATRTSYSLAFRGASGTINLYRNTGSLATTKTNWIAGWYHIVVTSGANGSKYYINGALENSTGTAGTDLGNTKNVNIGRGISGVYYLNGVIDDTRLYNSVISLSQVKEIYYAGLNSLLANNGITKGEYKKRLSETKNSYGIAK
jgi:prepilin-type N-terminal cleavage/methylation domain-containing protein